MRGMFSFGKLLAKGKKKQHFFSLLLKQPLQAFFLRPCSAAISRMKAAVVPKMTALAECFEIVAVIIGGVVVQVRHRQNHTTIFDRAVLKACEIELIVAHTTLFAGVM